MRIGDHQAYAFEPALHQAAQKCGPERPILRGADVNAEDLALTRRLAAAGTLMGIEVLDHLILGAGRFVSLKDRGVL